RRTDVADLLGAADVCVLPSVWEARSLTAQEALRAGTPLVATAVGGIPELVGDAADLVPAGDAEALAEAVTLVLSDPVRTARLCAAGPRQAATWPDEAATAQQLVELYRELLGPRR
ncbi:glycosyltransferase, partial [Modestobacter versicolor]